MVGNDIAIKSVKFDGIQDIEPESYDDEEFAKANFERAMQNMKKELQMPKTVEVVEKKEEKESQPNESEIYKLMDSYLRKNKRVFRTGRFGLGNLKNEQEEVLKDENLEPKAEKVQKEDLTANKEFTPNGEIYG